VFVLEFEFVLVLVLGDREMDRGPGHCSDGGDSLDCWHSPRMDKSRVRGHRDLDVWQCAIELATCAYGIADRLPSSERSGLVTQIRRSAASIPANIAEGSGRLYPKEFVRHISIARGSLMELDSHLEVALRSDLVSPSDHAAARALIDRVGPMLTNLAKALSHRS
jgi:four helix bundle protein